MSFQPLAGIRVLDVTTSYAGPFCSELLGALGADVVKVEAPDGGDAARTWGPPFWSGQSAIFLSVNAGKRSLAVDLRRGRDVLLRLADGADVFLQSLRPGLAEELGLGPEELRRRNPRLVYCSIGAFGRVGPWSEQPGFDPLMQAAGGIISVTGEPARPGVRVGVSLVDQGTGMWAAIAILAALHERERSGQGRVVDVSLYETALSYLSYHVTGYLGSGDVPRGRGTAFPSIVPYQAFAVSDGQLMVAAANDKLFTALAAAIGLPDLPADPRFATNPDRVAHREELAEILAERLATDTRSAWLERLEAAGVPAAPVQDVAEVAEAEQTAALGILQRLPHPAVPDLVVMAPPLYADGERVLHQRPAPLHGEHTAEVLAEAGYSEEEIGELAAAGIVRLAKSSTSSAR
jgi:crotonobetainyl-CoA:carnitine CoA-transferase CaiB-like acyl-CoA transferase